MSEINYKIGDCVQLMKELPANSVDLIVTDPPYALVHGQYKSDDSNTSGFMNKKWDASLPSVDVWVEALRVLKPGAFAFIMSAPRQDTLSEMIVRIGKAGFNTNFSSIYHCFASGFPKSQNMSKAIDKKLGAERPIVGTRAQRANSEDSKVPMNACPSEVENITVPASDDAKKMNGAYGGFQPKPAVEIIIVAMKPIEEKTYIAQAMKNGKGVTWLDDARIPFASEKDRAATQVGFHLENCVKNESQQWGMKDINTGQLSPDKGRFPANLLVSDDVLNDGTTSKGQYCPSTSDCGGDTWGGTIQTNRGARGYNDEGSFSRYFDIDKWAVSNGVKDTFPFMICPKASQKERTLGCEHGTASHPTIKPLKLMAYLVTLGSRKGELVLDPFLGSGTTLMACKLTERNGIGFELTAEYEDIIKRRIGACETLKQDALEFMRVG